MFNELNTRVKKLGWIDIALVKWSVFFATIILAKFFPQILKIDYWILTLLVLFCSAGPFYKFWVKKG